MTTFTIHAEKDGQSVQTVRISPAAAVAKAHSLLNFGWQVHITDANDRPYRPEKFDEILSFHKNRGEVLSIKLGLFTFFDLEEAISVHADVSCRVRMER